jgi:hypothetical protein
VRPRGTYAVAALAALTLAALAPSAASPKTKTLRPQAEQVFETFDRARPGYGPDPLAPTQRINQPMALGWYAVAAVRLGHTRQARVACDQLLAMVHKGGGRRVGWGLDLPFDAFRDGSTNPAGTVYAVTDAIAIRGLLDTYRLTGDRRYSSAVRAALDYYKRRAFERSTVGGRSGFFWYSDQRADIGRYVVYNATSLLAGQYARASVVLHERSYRRVALRAMRFLWARRRTDGDGTYWPYAPGRGGDNDWVHAAYLVQGILDFNRALPRSRLPISSAALHLRHQVAFSRSDDQRLWGIGMAMFTLASAGHARAAADVRRITLPRNRYARNRYGEYPGGHEFFPRHVAHLVAGLAALEHAGS